jgi:hypothetical protein
MEGSPTLPVGCYPIYGGRRNCLDVYQVLSAVFCLGTPGDSVVVLIGDRIANLASVTQNFAGVEGTGDYKKS